MADTIEELVARMDKLHADCAAAGFSCHLTIVRNDVQPDGSRGVHAAGRATNEDEIKLLMLTELSDHSHAARRLGFEALAKQMMATHAMLGILWNLDSSVTTERKDTVDG